MYVCVCVCMYVYIYVCVCVCSTPEFSLVDPPLISSLLVLQGKQRVLVIRLIALTKDSLFSKAIRNFFCCLLLFHWDLVLVQE